MTYYERWYQLQATLQSLQFYENLDFSVIIVDDGSVEQPLISEFLSKQGFSNNYNFPVKIYRIEPKNKTWLNSCIPFNYGFSKLDDDCETVIIQNAECIHYDSICHYTPFDNEYLVSTCFALNKEDTKKYQINQDKYEFNNKNGEWYHHAIMKNTNYHFCSLINRKNLDKLGGFDERYADFYGYDDDEFLRRIKRLGLKVITIGSLVLHQDHSHIVRDNFWVLTQPNKLLYDLTTEETDIKAKRLSEKYPYHLWN
jgi:hypothetical protein